MKEKKSSAKEKKTSAQNTDVNKPSSIKEKIISLKNNDNFIIAVELVVIALLVIALVFILIGNKGGSQGDGGNSSNLGNGDNAEDDGIDPSKQSFTYNAIVEYFNTSVKVIGYERTQDEFAKTSQDAVNLLGEYHRLFDIYNEYDGIVNLYSLNQIVDGQHPKLTVDRKIIDMLLYAKEMYNLTDGRMNVAMGSVLSIWHDYRDAGSEQPVEAELPPMNLLEEAAKHTDINSIVIDEVNSTVWISDPQTKLDVGAIAKGYAVERVAEMLEERGKTSYALNIGGNIRTIGIKANGDKWKTGIRDPKGEMYEYNEYVQLKDESIVTSGSYERYYIVFTGAECRECDWVYNQEEGIPEQDINPGTRPGDLKSSTRCPLCGSKIRRISEEFHHIIDPETLMPADRGYLSVSVICKDSGMGDGLSTALFCMDLDEALAFVNSLDGVEAMFVTEDEVKHYSNGFMAYTYTP